MAKILIVDDSAFMRNSLGMIVESGGHEVVGSAGDGKLAMELFKSLHPELVTLDYLMADISGETVLEEMILHDPGARVIMISGSGDQEFQARAMQRGAKVFLQKPCSQREILQAIDQVMEI